MSAKEEVYLFDYQHGGKTYSFDVYATSLEEANAKHSSMANAKCIGVRAISIPCGPLEGIARKLLGK